MRVALLVLLWPALVVAQSAGAGLYNEANRLYRDGQFDAARDRYLEVCKSGVRDARLFYNLGNAYFRAGQLGRAILWYERAQRLDPRDPDIRANLRFANAVKKDREDAGHNVVWRALVAAVNYPTGNELAVGLGLGSLAVFALAAARLLRQGPGTVLWYTALVGAVGLVLLSGTLLGARLHHRATVDEAIVVAPQATARGGPDRAQTAVFVVHEGTRVVLERREGEWALARLANGLGGWLPRQAVESIALPAAP